MVSLQDALARLLEPIKPVSTTAACPLTELLGRVLATDIESTINSPPTDNSAMDGYAINSCDVDTHEPKRFPISQTLSAGDTASPLTHGTAARILTGAPIPAGADTVVIQENCQLENNTVTVQGPISTGLNIRHCGQDVRSGNRVLAAGTTFKAPHMAMLASIGLDQATVFRRLRVAIASPGDELITPGQAMQAGKIYNSNHYNLLAQLQTLGCEVLDLGILPDELQTLSTTLKQAAHESDLIITSGGVSVGDKDFVKQAIEQLGQLELWRIAIKPGKPFAYGHIGNTPILGLPGNPVSQFVTFCLCARPFIMKLQGRNKFLPDTLWAEAGFDYQNNGSRDEYLRATVSADETGHNTIMKFDQQDSAMLSSLTQTNCLAIIPAQTAIIEGQRLRILPYSELQA